MENSFFRISSFLGGILIFNEKLRRDCAGESEEFLSCDDQCCELK